MLFESRLGERAHSRQEQWVFDVEERALGVAGTNDCSGWQQGRHFGYVCAMHG